MAHLAASSEETPQDETTEALIALSLEGHVLAWNSGAESTFGYSTDEAIGKRIEELVAREAPGGQARAAFAAAAHFGASALRTVVRRKDKTLIDVQLSMRRADDRVGPVFVVCAVKQLRPKPPVFDLCAADHTEAGTLVSAASRDVTDRKNLGQSTQEASGLKSEFLANMSHELRTPLNAIIGFADLMHRGKVGPVSPEHREYLGDILSSSRHLLQLINDVLDLAKVESGKIEFRDEAVDLGKLIAEVRDVLRGLASSQRINIEIERASSISSAVADPARVKQVRYDYSSNAIEFTPESGRIFLRLAEALESLLARGSGTGEST